MKESDRPKNELAIVKKTFGILNAELETALAKGDQVAIAKSRKSIERLKVSYPETFAAFATEN